MTKTMQRLTRAIEADQPAILWGPPGIGKTAAVKAMADEANAHLEVLIGSIIDPLDVGGLMVPDAQGKVVWSPPPWAVALRKALDNDKEAWLFLDEISCAPHSVQAALLRVVHERRAGVLSLEGCRILLAANPADTAADNGWLAPPMVTRLSHIEFEVDPGAWRAGELSGWGKPRKAAHSQAAGRICGYIAANPTALLPTQERKAKSNADQRGAPCPRSWSAAIRLLAVGGDSLDVESVVGPAAAAQWTQWDSQQDLPDPEDLLSGDAELPTRGDAQLAALEAVAACALQEHPNRRKRVFSAWHILGDLRPDIALGPGKALLLGAPGIIPDETIALGKRIMDVTSGV